MPTEYDQLFKRAGQTPSPGGLDLNALLQRGISGTIAGAREETDIRRRKDASDLLSAELAQAAQELENRVTGYNFGQEQRFDEALATNPQLQAALADAFSRSGNPFLVAPQSRQTLEAFHRFAPSVGSHNLIAASILENFGRTALPGQPEPPEVAWARNVLRVPTVGATAGTATGAPTAPAKPEPVKGGLGRAALGSAVTGAGAVGAGKLTSMALQRFAPKLLARVPYAGPVISLAGGLIGGGATQAGYESLVDPQIGQAQREHPIASTAGGVAGGVGAGKGIDSILKRMVDSDVLVSPDAAKSLTRGLLGQGTPSGVTQPQTRTSQMRTPPLLNPPPSQPSATGGPNLADFARRYKAQYGTFPSEQELAKFAQGGFQGGPVPQLNTEQMKVLTAPTKVYKPQVRGYEEFLRKYYGE